MFVLSAVQNTEIPRNRSATRALKSVCHFILTVELDQRFKRILIRIVRNLSPIMAIYNFSTITWRMRSEAEATLALLNLKSFNNVR